MRIMNKLIMFKTYPWVWDLNKYFGYFWKLIIRNYTLQQNSNLTTINLDWLLQHGVVTDLLLSAKHSTLTTDISWSDKSKKRFLDLIIDCIISIKKSFYSGFLFVIMSNDLLNCFTNSMGLLNCIHNEFWQS